MLYYVEVVVPWEHGRESSSRAGGMGKGPQDLRLVVLPPLGTAQFRSYTRLLDAIPIVFASNLKMVDCQFCG